MENSDSTIKLFNEVMDHLDSLSEEEFTEKLKQSGESELFDILCRAGYFSKYCKDYEPKDNPKNS